MVGWFCGCVLVKRGVRPAVKPKDTFFARLDLDDKCGSEWPVLKYYTVELEFIQLKLN